MKKTILSLGFFLFAVVAIQAQHKMEFTQQSTHPQPIVSSTATKPIFALFKKQKQTNTTPPNANNGTPARIQQIIASDIRILVSDEHYSRIEDKRAKISD
jgi:hypothetical protein